MATPCVQTEAGTPALWGFGHGGAYRTGAYTRGVRSRCGATADVVTTGASIPGPFSRDETAIIFDFDDTLFPSSFVDRRKLIHARQLEDLPAELQKGFADLERIVGRLLSSALHFGTVLIITNAQTGWVELCVGKFMPGLTELLGAVRVVSARSSFERFFPGDPLCWKAAAFAHELHQLQKASGGALRNVMSFGDSIEERTAVKIASGQLHSRAKSVKFLDQPSPRQLQHQIEVVTNCLEWIWRHNGDLDVVLTLEQQPGDAPPSPPATPRDVHSNSNVNNSNVTKGPANCVENRGPAADCANM